MNRRLGMLALAGCAVFAPSIARASGIDKGPYLMKPTQTGITVCWVSGAATEGKVAVAGMAQVVKDAAPTRYHRVTLSGLKPYTRYSFTVECEGKSAPGTFMTAAAPEQSFKFVAYGDNRSQPKVHAEVLAAMSKFGPDFVVQSGDQVADGNNEEQWDEFWQIASKALSQTAYYPSLGNHEKNGSPYFRFFAVPREYSFDYGNTHFVALDSNRTEGEFAAQDAWLRADLRAHQSAKWRVVFFHHTIHTCVDKPGRRAESAERAKRLEPIFEEEHVQLVINGHDHDYQRHVAHGITYIVTGGGGAPLYSVTPDTPYVKVAKMAHHFCELVVTGDTIAVRAVGLDGGVIDQFTLTAGTPAQ